MSEQSIENKQKYLRQKILEKGYDAQAFMGYCQQKYGQIDLQGWSFAKLKQIVKGYLGQNAEETFTQQQLDNQQAIVDEFQYVPQVNYVSQNTAEVKKQFVFTDADWQIFGLGGPQKKQANSSALTNNSNSFMSMSPPSGLPIAKKNNLQNIPKNVGFQQIFTFTNTFTNTQQKQLPKSPSPTQISNIQKVQPEINSKLVKSASSNQNQNFDKKNQTRQVEQPKFQEINKAGLANQIKQIGSFTVNVVSSRQLPPLPPINEIKIINTQQVTKNFLQGDYTLYHIQFCPCNIIVKKKLNDLRKLRTLLLKVYPHIRLPYIQPEGWLVNSSEVKDTQTLNKYKYMIIQFLKYVTIKNQLLKKSKIVRLFTGLIESTPSDLKKYQNIARPKQFFQMCLPNGKLQFTKYENIMPVDKFMNNLQILNTNIDAHYQKLRKSLQTLFYNYQSVGKSLIQVAGIFQSLQSLIQKFNFDNDKKKDLRVYEGIKQVCVKMKQRIDSQSQIFRNRIQSLFKYERENMTTFKQNNQIRVRMFNEYCRQGLNTKKSTQVISKGETSAQNNISIEQPSKTSKINLTIQNMFWSYFTLKNVEQYWDELRFKINQKLTMIAYDQLDAQNDNLNFWNTVIKKCVI